MHQNDDTFARLQRVVITRDYSKMVRLKHRYLLVNILYLDSTTASNASETKKNGDLPYTVQFRQPTPDRLDAKLFTRAIRDGVAELFGDYGSGMVAGSLQGTKHRNVTTRKHDEADKKFSQVLLQRNKHRHRARLARPLSIGVGGSYIYYASA